MFATLQSSAKDFSSWRRFKIPWKGIYSSLWLKIFFLPYFSKIYFFTKFVWSPYRVTNPRDFPYKGLKIIPYSLRSFHVLPSNCVYLFSTRVMKSLAITIQKSDTLLSLLLALVWSSTRGRRDSISLRKQQQFVVTHAVCQTEISALLGNLITNRTSIKMLCPHKHCLCLYRCKNKQKCLQVGLFRISQVFFFSVSWKIVYRWA